MRTQLVLTQRGVEAAKPKAKRYGKPDGTVPGLRLVVFPSGEKTYALFTRVNGRLINHKIGSATVLGLASARKEARRKLEEISGGQDPRETRREAKRAESETVEVVTGRFIERYVKPKNKSWEEIQRKFDVEVLPHWGKRPISSITQRDVIELLDLIVDRGGLGTQANRVLASIRRLFNWSIERGLVSQSPTDRVKAPVPETPRDRVLSDSELALILRAADIVGHPFGPYFKILILTGTRREEVAGMRWSELDSDLTIWTIPRERVKNGIEHTIRLPLGAIDRRHPAPYRGQWRFCLYGKRQEFNLRLLQGQARTRRGDLKSERRRTDRTVANSRSPTHLCDRIGKAGCPIAGGRKTPQSYQRQFRRRRRRLSTPRLCR